MKFIPLHTTNTTIVYKNSLCSMATILVLVLLMLSVMIPLLLVSLLSPYSGIAESRILYEQPRVQFQFESIFMAETDAGSGETTYMQPGNRGLVVCSTFPNFNAHFELQGQHCEGIKYWTDDFDHDTYIDRAHFELQLDSLPGRITNLDLVLFFEAKLKHKCNLSPPAVLTYSVNVPPQSQLSSGTILVRAELKLKQYIEFTCPFPGRTTKTHFRPVQLNTNASAELQQFQLESLLQQLKANPAYFQLGVQETYFRRDAAQGLRLRLELDVLQIAARYHLSVWERLGQFWLYFASFFGISFYVLNKTKDFLFGRHIIRAWEIIPWKKLY